MSALVNAGNMISDFKILMNKSTNMMEVINIKILIINSRQQKMLYKKCMIIEKFMMLVIVR